MIGVPDRYSGYNPEATANRRRRSCDENIKLSYFSTITAITLAASCLVSSASAFTSTDKTSFRGIGIVHSYYSRTQPLGVGPFGSRTPWTALVSSSALFNAKGPDPETEEWRAILAAFQLYKAAYGDLRVPTRFVVPSMKPWPETAWGMKLGLKVSQIRSTGKYVDANERRKKQLDKLGFIWRVRAQTESAKDAGEIPFDQIYDALLVFQREVKPDGPLTVPVQFTVPDSDPWPESIRGLPLGRSAEKLRSAAYLQEHPGAEEKLLKIGFQLDRRTNTNDLRFQNVYIALKRYKEVYGDLMVPQPFQVPSESSDWPEGTWGLRLGARVNAIRSQGTFVKNHPERKQMLEDLGFVWSPPESERRKRGRKAAAETDAQDREAFERMATSVAGTSGRPTGPSTEEPSDLESFVASLDFGSASSDGASEETIAPTWGFEGGLDVQNAMVSAQEEANQQTVQDEYKPPQNLEDSLREARDRAVEVGIIAYGEGKHMVKGKRQRDIPWFNDDFGGEFVFEDVVEALTMYKSFYGNFLNLTDEEFVIPIDGEIPSPFGSDDDDYGMVEGDASTRAAAAVARFDELDDLALTEDNIEAEISRLEQDALSPEQAVATTVAPDIQVEWPEHLGGMRLGNIVSRIRDGSLEVKHLPERKEQLDALDFDWGDPKCFIDVPFEKAMCAMYAYYLVRGDMFVPADFVMPDEDPWPQALAGYEVGQAVKRIRELQNFMEAYHTEKVSLLRMIDFVWFPTLALPVDPNEPEMTPEMLRLCALGHPDYARWLDIPMGLPDKIIAEGPFLDSDDPKLWWRKWHNWECVKDYWYEMGRRDNAFVLRGLGYPQMAAEHEEKYGIGLFAQIEDTLDILEAEDSVIGGPEKDELLKKLKYYRKELKGCRDLRKRELEKLVEQIDTHVLELVTGKKDGAMEDGLEETALDYEEEALEEYEEYVEEVDREAAEQESEEEYEVEHYEKEESSLDSELGLDTAEEAQ